VLTGLALAGLALAGLASVPTWVRSQACARKLDQVNSGMYAIQLLSWAANCHQAV